MHDSRPTARLSSRIGRWTDAKRREHRQAWGCFGLLALIGVVALLLALQVMISQRGATVVAFAARAPGVEWNDREQFMHDALAAFKTKLRADGLQPASSRGGMAEWAGMHGPESTNQWYEGSIDDSPPLRVRISTYERGFSVYLTWGVRDFAWRLDDHERQFNAYRQRLTDWWYDYYVDQTGQEYPH